ncbi:MAG: hypothetical protein MUP47_05195, partial [Phycisphaerae bacterium]|nr:hypothetical protein [Phycisphaerae bacterium]
MMRRARAKPRRQKLRFAEDPFRAGRQGPETIDQRQRQQYAQHRVRAARRQAEIAEAGQEIGPPPAVAKPKRRAACERDFKRYCETYEARVFYLPWSANHMEAIHRLEEAILHG